MFQSFHIARAWHSEKGQLAPLFIVVLVVMLIMTLVTVNLNKVAFYKTGTSNGSDAGGLAGGSVMANLFNAIAVSNSYIEVGYWEFFASISISFVLLDLQILRVCLNMSTAITDMGTVAGQACSNPCSAIAKVTKIITYLSGTVIERLQSIITSILVLIATVTWFWIGQQEYIGMVIDTAVQGRQTALQMGIKFAFMNSGVSGRLKSGNPPGSASGAQRNFYSNEFSAFMDDITFDVDGQTVNSGIAPSYTYTWEDPDQRFHQVDTSASTMDVRKYSVKVTLLNFVAEVATLTGAMVQAIIAYMKITAAVASLTSANIILAAACICYNLRNVPYIGAAMTACYMALCAVAAALIAAAAALTTTAMITTALIAVTTAIAWAGLAPAGNVDTTDSSFDLEIPCWIEEIDHNRLFHTRTELRNEGAVLGLWNSTYPATDKNKAIESWTVTDFTGDGEIFEPDPSFDPSIHETDQL